MDNLKTINGCLRTLQALQVKADVSAFWVNVYKDGGLGISVTVFTWDDPDTPIGFSFYHFQTPDIWRTEYRRLLGLIG